MSTAVRTERIAEASPGLKARIAGVFYLVKIATAALALPSGILGEGALTLWLLAKGVKVQRWKDLKAAKL
jgi:hypothetical protein